MNYIKIDDFFGNRPKAGRMIFSKDQRYYFFMAKRQFCFLDRYWLNGGWGWMDYPVKVDLFR
ncbi:MAG: hypothetical protein R2814_05330 [Flavobacteriaceae bacterium]